MAGLLTGCPDEGGGGSDPDQGAQPDATMRDAQAMGGAGGQGGQGGQGGEGGAGAMGGEGGGVGGMGGEGGVGGQGGVGGEGGMGGEGGQGGMGGMPMAPCDVYCASMAETCPGTFANDAECQATCALYPDGEQGAQQGDTVQCRIYHADVASRMEPEVHCAHAGPTGDGVCGDLCQVYCNRVLAHCGGDLNPYADEAACLEACAAFPQDGAPDAVDGDSVQCRIYHATVPAAAEPDTHCPHAGPDGGGVCVPICGNGRQEGDEACDDGNLLDGDGCDSNCTVTACGNGVATEGEACDDGNAEDGDGCDSNCTESACGNGIQAGDEACDDGNLDDNDGCDSNCTPTACGNGVQAGDEACDDGNLLDGDGCDSDCSVTACGNGIATEGEACDDGNAVDGDGCDGNCTVSACGNGVQAGDEACDDGNLVDGDGCDANCTPTGCGNGVATAGEACDDGNAIDDDGCDSNCTVPGCGNGVLNEGEACDDGNLVDGDGCDANCTVTACGNDIATEGEACDDGNLEDGDGCDSDCSLTACGNGIVTEGEACDDGNPVDGDGCDSNCTETACGNGVATEGEACDDGNLVEGDGCDSNCTVSACGNGVTAGAEACDDGNLVDGDGCDSNCTDTGCGNGVLTEGERCDDGNAIDGDGCDNNCTETACGNGVVTEGEGCDDGNLEDGDGCDSNCTATACGNGILTDGERCDDGNPEDGDGCDSNCTETACGNGVVTGDEQCDDGNLVEDDGCSRDCRIGCQVDADCAEGTVCRGADEGRDGRCVPPAVGACDAPQQAGFGRFVGFTEGESQLTGSCGGGGSPEAVYQVAFPEAGTVCLNTNGSDFDTVLHVRVGDCGDALSEVQAEGQGCNDDNNQFARNFGSAIELEAQAGLLYFVIVDGFGNAAPGRSGAYQLSITPGPCEAPPECLIDADCGGEGGDGFCVDNTCIECRDDADCAEGRCGAASACVECVEDGDCGEGVCDLDANACVACLGDADCAEGQGCVDNACVLPAECLEDAECGEGQRCFETVCVGAQQGTCEAPTPIAVGDVVDGVTEGEGVLAGACNNRPASPEHVFEFSTAEAGTVCLNTFGSQIDTVLYVLPEPCGDAGSVACNDDNRAITGGLQSAIDFEPVPNTTYYVVVDGYTNAVNAPVGGRYRLAVTAGACQPPPQCLDDADCQDENGVGGVCVDGECAECRDAGDCGPGEQCLDGACRLEPGCGNGQRDEGEECDDGNDIDGDVCDSNCTLPGCGNGIQAGDELCDDGNDADGDGCDSNCTPTGCGNGVLTDAEECDDGNLVDGDGCSAECVLEFDCGNGEVEFPEQCDDANAVEDDACDTLCTQTAYDLIDGRRQIQAGFVAGQQDRVRFTLDDAGAFLAQTSDGEGGCPANTDTRLFLYPLVDGARGALVDSNDDAGGTTCSRLAIPNLPAGDYELEIDGFNNSGAPAYTLDVLATMLAAPGQDSAGAIPQAGGADLFALTVVAADTQVTTSDGAGGCPNDTTLTVFALAPDGTRGEQVAFNDDGGPGLCSQLALPPGQYELRVAGFNQNPVAPYVLSVRAPGECGDNIVNLGEQCDPGPDQPDDFCDAECQLIPGCGNGVVEDGEECDDGNQAVEDGCDAACQREPVCGDGFVDEPEACDDGNQEDGDGCSAQCAFEQECGNGEQEGDEACDDGNVVSGDGCDSGCTEEEFAVIEGREQRQGGFAAGANDIFRFTADGPARLRVRTSLDGEPCPIGTIDTRIFVETTGEGGETVVVADNDDAGGGDRCSVLDVAVPPGDHWVRVTDFGNDDAVAAYRLDFELRQDVSAGGDFPGAFVADGDDLFVLDVVEGGEFVIATNNGAGGCGVDTRMWLYPLDEAGQRGEPVFNDDGGNNGFCSQIVRALEIGRYEIEVDGFGGGAIDAYVLSVDLPGECGDGEVNLGEECDPGADVPDDFCDAECQLLPGCGNGVVEDGEVCDDGNQAPGDGCDPACTEELFEVLAGRYAAEDVVDQLDVHTFAVDGPGTRVTAVLTGPVAGCAAPGVALGLTTLDDQNQPIIPPVALANPGVDGCATVDLVLDDAGLYGVGPFNQTGQPQPYGVQLLVRRDVGAGGDFAGGFSQDGDDLYTFELAEARTVVLSTGDGQGGCPGDTRLALFAVEPDGSRGAQVAQNDDGGDNGLCSQIQTDLEPGTYELRAFGFGNRAIPAYTLSAELLFPLDAVDYCRLQFPDTITVDVDEAFTAFGIVFEDGVTTVSDLADANPRLLGQAGLGPVGSDPVDNEAWTWVDAEPNPGWNAADRGEPNNDEYRAELTAGAAGDYALAYRFSADGGRTWTLCDLGEGNNDGYQPENAGAVRATRAPQAGDLVITEVMQNPAAPIDDAVGEWFELYNASAAPLNLVGLVVADDATANERFTIDQDVVLLPGAFAVIAREVDEFNGGVGADFVWSGSLSLGNGDDGIVLEDAQGNELDRVVWDNGDTFPDPSGASMQLGGRRDAANVDNAFGPFWCEGDVAYAENNLGTPGAANTACPDPDPQPVQDLLDRDCTGCHGGSGGISLENVSTLIPGVTAGGSGLPAIVAGDPDGSYLYAKIAGTHLQLDGGRGNRMPPFGDPWSAEDLQVLADYITLVLPPQD